LIVGYTIGRVHSYYKNRIQCVNCGSFRTYWGAAGYNKIKGSKCDFPVKTFEAHECNKCGQGTSLKMDIINYE
jgi:ribosomal protein S14